MKKNKNLFCFTSLSFLAHNKSYTTLNGVNVLESSHKKNVLLGVTCRSRLNNNSHILLVRHISIDSLLNPDKDNNNQNSSSNGSSAAVGDNSNNLNINSNSNNSDTQESNNNLPSQESNNNLPSQESNNNLPSQQVSENEDRNVNETDRSEDEMDLDPSDDGDGYESNSDRSFFEEGVDAMEHHPAQDLPDDILRKYKHDLGDIVRHPWKAGIDGDRSGNAELRQEKAERYQELKDELQRRKDEGIIPEDETISKSSSDSGDVPGDLKSSNTQSGGSGDHGGVGTSTATNNKSSTGSDTFSRLSNENSPDSFDNFLESDYLFDSLYLDSYSIEYVIILDLSYIRILLLLLPFVFLLKRYKLL
jgi:hypothetical protein